MAALVGFNSVAVVAEIALADHQATMEFLGQGIGLNPPRIMICCLFPLTGLLVMAAG